MISYSKSISETLNQLPYEQIQSTALLIEEAKSIFVIGNGGSQATAEHFVTDLIKLSGKKAHTVSNTSLLTMAGNDFGYEHSFSWLIDRLSSDGDLIIGISTSGKSKNVLRSLVGNTKVKTVLISGPGGLDFSKHLDSNIIIPSTNTQILEDVSSIVCHMISLELERRRFR